MFCDSSVPFGQLLRSHRSRFLTRFLTRQTIYFSDSLDQTGISIALYRKTMPRRLPPLTSVRAFEAAARHLSFVRAAGELQVTPAAIGQQVKQLEDYLGVQLFLRAAGGLELTEAAGEALPLISSGFDSLAAALERLNGHRDDRPLVVSTCPSFASRWLIPRIDRFEAAMPGVELRLLTTRRLVDFASEDVDVAIRYGAGNYPGLFSKRLGAEVVVVVAAPPLAAQLSSPADLLDAVLLHNDATNGDTTFPDWPGWLKSHGVEPTRPLRIRHFEDASLVLDAARAGLGVAIVWQILAAEDLRFGRLSTVCPATRLAKAFHFVCPPRHLDRPKIPAFRDWLIAELEGGRRDCQRPCARSSAP